MCNYKAQHSFSVSSHPNYHLVQSEPPALGLAAPPRLQEDSKAAWSPSASAVIISTAGSSRRGAALLNRIPSPTRQEVPCEDDVGDAAARSELLVSNADITSGALAIFAVFTIDSGQGERATSGPASYRIRCGCFDLLLRRFRIQ